MLFFKIVGHSNWTLHIFNVLLKQYKRMVHFLNYFVLIFYLCKFVALLVRVSTPGLCHAGLHRFKPRPLPDTIHQY